MSAKPLADSPSPGPICGKQCRPLTGPNGAFSAAAIPPYIPPFLSDLFHLIRLRCSLKETGSLWSFCSSIPSGACTFGAVAVARLAPSARHDPFHGRRGALIIFSIGLESVLRAPSFSAGIESTPPVPRSCLQWHPPSRTVRRPMARTAAPAAWARTARPPPSLREHPRPLRSATALPSPLHGPDIGERHPTTAPRSPRGRLPRRSSGRAKSEHEDCGRSTPPIPPKSTSSISSLRRSTLIVDPPWSTSFPVRSAATRTCWRS